jgi:hypothetical protein
LRWSDPGRGFVSLVFMDHCVLLGSSLMLLTKALKDFFICGFDANELMSGVILTFANSEVSGHSVLPQSQAFVHHKPFLQQQRIKGQCFWTFGGKLTTCIKPISILPWL